MTKHFAVLATAFALAAAMVATACSNEAVNGPDASSAAPSTAADPDGLTLVLQGRPAPVDDLFEVFVCDVPVPTSDPTYGDLVLRLPLDPVDLAEKLDEQVPAWFDALSDGMYHPRFAAGQVLAMTTDETHDQCVDRAIAVSEPTAAAVLVVATAENLSTEPGGWGKPGTACPVAFCPASQTGRSLYVGASDFHPDNGPVPLLDLVEHEIGHTLDLPHSGDGSPGTHASAIDMMSDSAAPRLVQPARIHAQDTLAINRLALGWFTRDDLAVVPAAGDTYDLAASNGHAGLRLLVLPEDDGSFLTVEYLAASGLDDFLPVSGIAVHRIDQSPAACGRPPTGAPCTGYERAQVTLGGPAPHLDLLHGAGSSWDVDGWTVTVMSGTVISGTADGMAGGMAGVRVEVRPTDG